MAATRWLALLGMVLAAPAVVPAQEAVCEEILVAMEDGTRLHGWARHGANAGVTRPIVWTMTPYTNTGCPNGSAFDTMTPEMVERVTMVRLSYRGTGASEGEQDTWGPGDREDILDLGDWLAARPYADGLFPTGASAEGAWIAFALDHQAVRAALWITSCADGYRGCVRSGGALAGGGAILTAGQTQGYARGLDARIRNGTTNPAPPAQVAAAVVNGAPAFTEDHDGPFWSSRLGLHFLDAVSVPVMFTTDPYDYVPHGMYLAYERTPAASAWLSIAIGHNSPRAVIDDATPLGQLAKEPVHRFLEKYLFDEGGSDPARVRLMTNLGTPSGYKRAEVLVRDEDDWPLPSTRWTRLYLDAPAGSPREGSLSLAAPAAEGADVFPLASVNGPKGELRTLLAAYGAAGAALGSPELLDTLARATLDDLRADEALGLTWTTPPLAADTELTGPVVLHVRATATAPSFDWQVRVADVHPDGRSAWITDGQLRASLRRVDDARSVRNADGDYVRPWLPFDAHEPVPVGEPVDYVIELAPTSNVFRAGHRIRLDVQPLAEGYLDSARSAGAGVLEIHRGGASPSRLVVPVIPARCQLGEPASADVVKPVCADALSFAP